MRNLLLPPVILLLSSWRAARAQKCQPITHEMCIDLPYNLTSFPNMVGEENYKDASESISTYKALLSVVCSEQLKFFLCSVYFPMCNEKIAQSIGPCRPLCLSVKEKCLPVLEGFGFSWPDAIRCEKFPLENNRDKMCMKGPNEEGTIQHEKPVELFDETNDKLVARHCTIDEVFVKKSGKCVPLCTGTQRIAQVERDAATKLLLFLASCSVILTLLSTFIVIISRFGALNTIADVSLFFASVSFAVSAVVYIFSISFREQVSCTDYTHHLLFVIGGLSHVPCSSVGSLIYYSSTCGRFWWLLLCFTWNRATRTSQMLEEATSRIHMLVWGIPLGPLMLALLAMSISANPLTGICMVGASSNATDWIFNFMRELILFVVCTFALTADCCRLLGSDFSEVNSFAGIIAAFYPISALFYMLSFVNEAAQPAVSTYSKTFNIVSSLKFSFDLVLSLIITTLCFIYFLSRISKSPNSKASKEGYQPAVPNLPQPAIPVAARSNTYASTFRTNMI
ncbi:unnamed protein product [Caenorhabditis bovis]|uniref:Frizzled-4 n=1 Tax=Caenorhabditis bovis TaxID=2654633 RepID=A0A8S1F7P6_9PELO|nr:unnamed protein product [Caenorhabditis bovis]